MLPKLIAIVALLGCTTGCDYIEKPKTTLLTGNILSGRAGIQFGGGTESVSLCPDSNDLGRVYSLPRVREGWR